MSAQEIYFNALDGPAMPIDCLISICVNGTAYAFDSRVTYSILQLAIVQIYDQYT